MSYLFAAAAVVWVGMLLCVIVFMQRQRRLATELRELRQMLTETTTGQQ